MSKEELLMEEQLMSSNRFAKVVGISPQSVINFVEQGRLIPHSKVETGSNNGKPKFHYYFTQSQVEEARFIAKKGKTNNHVLALCFADSKGELDKMADIVRKTLAEERGLEEVSSFGEFYNKTRQENEQYWKDSQELKDYIIKEVEKKRDQEILLINSDFDYNVSITNANKLKQIKASVEKFMKKVAEMIQKSEEAFADKPIDEITAELFGVDFPQVFNNTLITTQTTEYCKVLELIKEKVRNESIPKLGNLQEDLFKDAKRFTDICNFSLKECIKRKEKNQLILTKRFMSEEESIKAELEFGKTDEYYDDSLKKRYAIGDFYSKVKEQCTLSYIDKKQKEFANKRNEYNESVSTLFSVKKVLVSDKEELQQAFIKMLSREFGQVYVIVNSCLDENTIILLECLGRTKCIDITVMKSQTGVDSSLKSL